MREKEREGGNKWEKEREGGVREILYLSARLMLGATKHLLKAQKVCQVRDFLRNKTF